MTRTARALAVGIILVVVLAACKPWDGVPAGTHARDVDNHSFLFDRGVTKKTSDCVRAKQLYGYIGDGCSLSIEIYGYLNWSTDGCSAGLIDQSFVASFLKSCVQHDFCYRNWPEVQAHTGYQFNTESTRLRCDDRLYQNMQRDCDNSGVFFAWCEAAALASYQLVRQYGHMGSDRI